MQIDLERFVSKIIQDDSECWNWSGSLKTGGYGTFSYRKNEKQHHAYSHRISYMLFKSTIPKGMVLDHICKNRACCNPEHLRAVTRSQNSNYNSEGVTAKNLIKDRCKCGRPFDIVAKRSGNRTFRACRHCKRNSDSRSREKKRLLRKSLA